VPAGDLDGLAARFAAAHLRRYGFEMSDAIVQIVSVRVTATVSVPKPPLARSELAGDAGPSTRSAHFDGAWHDVDVFRPGDLAVGSLIDGPAIVEFPEATCVVRPGWSARADPAGALVLERA
jgi:N-methylhydantoinase A